MIMNIQPFTSRRFHFIIDAFGCEKKLLSDKALLIELTKKIADLLDMKIIKGPEIAEGVPANPGLTIFAIIDFSHISIHTFTNTSEFCLDIFSCKSFDYKKLENFVKENFKITDKQIFKSIVRYDQLNIERDKATFSPQQYLAEYYKQLSKENIQLLDWYKRIYKNIPDNNLLLEIGGGPTIYQLISATPKVKEIFFTDFSQKNLDTVKKWIKEKNSFWDKFIKYSLGEKSVSIKNILERKNQIAGKIKNLVLLDAGKMDNSLKNKFDIVQSNFCLESSTDDISEYKRMLKNIFYYLKPKGMFLMTALEGAVAYKVGKKYFPAIYLDKELVTEYLTQAGFKIETMEKVFSDNSDSSKYHGFLFVKAIRK